jgi:hypothetical protein
MCEREDPAHSLLVPISGQLYHGPSPLISLPPSIVFFHLTCCIPASPPLTMQVHTVASASRVFGPVRQRYTASDSVTPAKPLIEHRTAGRMPYEDLGTSVVLRRKGRELTSETISLVISLPQAECVLVDRSVVKLTSPKDDRVSRNPIYRSAYPIQPTIVTAGAGSREAVSTFRQ